MTVQPRKPRRLRAVSIAAALAMALAACGGPAKDEPVRKWGYLTLPTGEQMRYSVTLPKASGTFPVLIEYDGYSAGTEPSIGAPWVEEGYAVVGLNVPGTGCSTGADRVFDESVGAAGAFGVEWAAGQPWSNGNVGMVGYSYAGYDQLWTAAQHPKGLRAITPNKNVTDPYRDVGYPGGIPNIGFPHNWWAEFPKIWRGAADRAKELDDDTRCAATVADNIAKAQKPEGDFGAQMSAHPFYDPFWAEHSAVLRTGKIEIPVLSTQSWQDEQVGPRTGYYEETLAPERTWLIGSNGDHHTDMTAADIRDTMKRFLARYVKGEDNGFEREPHVRVLQELRNGGDKENPVAKPTSIAEYPALPVPVKPMRLWLNRAGELTDHPAESNGGALDYRYPRPGSVVNNPLAEGWAPDTAPDGRLTFTTAVLPQALNFYGAGSADLWLSSTAPDTDIQVTLSEVRPDGQEMFVQRGWLRASQRRLDPTHTTELRPWNEFTEQAAEPLTPGTPTQLRVEIPKFAHTFRPGSSVRLTVDTPAQTGFWQFGNLKGEATNTILLDSAHPSSIVLGYHPAPHAEALPSCTTTMRQPCRPNTVPVPPGRGPNPPA
ncbi:CocE/NonD family hydrolase [Nocardia panacis]|nr:CocE/NonD family hydrolase [Nocardia panacis]